METDFQPVDRAPGLDIDVTVVHRLPGSTIGDGAILELVKAARVAASEKKESKDEDIDVPEEPAVIVQLPRRITLPEEDLERDLGLRR